MMRILNNYRTILLNAWPAFVAFAYQKPLNFLRSLFSRETLNKITSQIYDPTQSDELKAFSAAFGIFMAFMPVWGFQTFIAIFVAVALKLNKALVVLFLQISMPPLMPLIVLLSYKAGSLLIGNNPSGAKMSAENIDQHLKQYISGSLMLAVAAAIAIGILALVSLKLARAFNLYKVIARFKNAYSPRQLPLRQEF